MYLHAVNEVFQVLLYFSCSHWTMTLTSVVTPFPFSSFPRSPSVVRPAVKWPHSALSPTQPAHNKHSSPVQHIMFSLKISSIYLTAEVTVIAGMIFDKSSLWKTDQPNPLPSGIQNKYFVLYLVITILSQSYDIHSSSVRNVFQLQISPHTTTYLFLLQR